jgi:hypothetical protein
MRRYTTASAALCAWMMLPACGYSGTYRPLPETDAATDAGAGPGDAGVLEPVGLYVTEYQYQPKLLPAVPGTTLPVILRNQGTAVHRVEFVARVLQGPDEDVVPGAAVPFSVDVPETPGEYEFFCPIENHRELGEVGILLVLPQ